ncbi:MAG: replication-associated recombination protein A [Filifactor alocis]|nr:replication-associated recombination protein A [Filifactor alocis]
MNIPFAELIRPKNISQVVGQQHIIGKDKLINRLVETKKMINLIFFGPPGTGKTTVAEILAGNSNLNYYKLNATYSKTQDIRDIASEINTLSGYKGILIYIDEIQNFNKKQQQLLLDYIEKGEIILIASTTENPYHSIYKSLLSRCTIIEFHSLDNSAVKRGIYNAIDNLEEQGFRIECEDENIGKLIDFSGGDLRKALNTLGTMLEFYSKDKHLKINEETLLNVCGTKTVLYDRNSDEHYDILSAFQKSIRGSDIDASLHYLARLLRSGDLISACRRLLVIASEDIGLAYPQAAAITKSCVDTAFFLGLPEARIPLAQAVIMLAGAPKSNSAIVGIDAALNDLDKVSHYPVPNHLKDAHYSGAKQLDRGLNYKYPHDYPNSYITQTYLPESLKDAKYYYGKDNKMENGIAEHFRKIKK